MYLITDNLRALISQAGRDQGWKNAAKVARTQLGFTLFFSLVGSHEF